jgi:diaminopropionate ammonia-lyase
VARVAKWFGIGASVFMPEGSAAARIDGIESEGASVTVVEGDYDDAVAAAAELSGGDLWLIQDTGWEGYEEVPERIVDGYSTIMIELDSQMEEAGEPLPDLVAVQIGVGSLASAVISHFRRAGGEVVIAGVEPDEAACAFGAASAGRVVTVPGPHRSVMAGLNCGTVSAGAWPVLAGGIDLFVTVSDEDAFDAMRALASDGIVSGESGSAGLAGISFLLRSREGREALESLGTGPDPSVLVVSTEGITDPELYGRVVSPPGR